MPRAWWTFRIFFIFFPLGEGKGGVRGARRGESEAPGGGESHFLLKIPGGTLIFFSLLFGVPCFFAFRGIPCFFRVFILLFQEFKGFGRDGKSCGGFPCLFAKEQGKEDQGGVPGGAEGPGGCLRRIGEFGGGGGGLFFCSGPKRPRSVSNGVSGGGSQALEREDLGPWWSGGVRVNPSFTSELWLAKRTSQSPWPKHKAPSHQFRGMSNASSRTRS